MILIKLVFNMVWLMVNIKIWLKTQSHKALRDKAFKIASNLKYDGYQRGLDLMDTSFLMKKICWKRCKSCAKLATNCK